MRCAFDGVADALARLTPADRAQIWSIEAEDIGLPVTHRQTRAARFDTLRRGVVAPGMLVGRVDAAWPTVDAGRVLVVFSTDPALRRDPHLLTPAAHVLTAWALAPDRLPRFLPDARVQRQVANPAFEHHGVRLPTALCGAVAWLSTTVVARSWFPGGVVLAGRPLPVVADVAAPSPVAVVVPEALWPTGLRQGWA